MGNVDQVLLEAVAIENFAAAARHQGTGFLRRQPFAAPRAQRTADPAEIGSPIGGLS
jgi:hypothetical protein